MTRAVWNVNLGTVLAHAVGVFDTRFYGTSLTAPVGTNTAAALQLFEYAALYVQAGQNATQVQIDLDANGTVDVTQTLNAGQTYVSAGTVRAGARVTADKPVQAALLTGDIDASYESRSFNLVPDLQLSNDYYSPIATTNAASPAQVFVHNPNATALAVTVETTTGTSTLSVPARGTAAAAVPLNSAVHLFSADGRPFAAVSVSDVGTTSGTGQNFDWGATLQATDSLSPIAVVAWAPGSSNLPPAENYSPVWVTLERAATLYVDYDGNPATGPNTDPLGNRYDVSFDLARLQSQRVFDPDRDQTGMRLYTVDGTNVSAAWGEDPSVAPVGAPAMDIGTTIPAFPVPKFNKSAGFAPGGDLNGDGIFNAGERVRYTLTIENRGLYPILNAVVTDALPAEVTYLAGTARVDGSPILDDPTGTPFPLDPPSGYTVVNVGVGAVTVITFEVAINTGLPGGTVSITNLADLSFGITVVQDRDTSPVRAAVGDRVWNDLNGNGIDDAEPGLVGVTLDLYRDLNGNGLIDAGEPLVRTAATDGTGRYQFADLDQGAYVVDLTDAGGVLAGGVRTAGADPRPVVLDAGESDQSVDFGYALNVADLRVTKTDGRAAYTPGGSIAYTIVVTNSGPSPVTGATVTDALPAALTGASWTAVYSVGGSGPLSGSGSIAAAVNLASGAFVTFTVTATVRSDATGDLANTASVAPPTGVVDPDPTNNSATDTDTRSPVVDLVVVKTDGATSARPGDTLTYTITVRSVGPTDASGVVLTDALPAYTTFLSASDGGTHAGGVVTWAVGGLPAGVTVIRTVTVRVNTAVPAGAAALTNSATAAADPADGPDPTRGTTPARTRTPWTPPPTSG